METETETKAPNPTPKVNTLDHYWSSHTHNHKAHADTIRIETGWTQRPNRHNIGDGWNK